MSLQKKRQNPCSKYETGANECELRTGAGVGERTPILPPVAQMKRKKKKQQQ